MTNNIITLSEERVYSKRKTTYRLESVALYDGMRNRTLQGLAADMISHGVASKDDEFAVYRNGIPVFQNAETGSNFMPLWWYADGRPFGLQRSSRHEAVG